MTIGFAILSFNLHPWNSLGFAGVNHATPSSFLSQLRTKKAMSSSMCSLSEDYEEELCEDTIVTFNLADAGRIGLGIVTVRKTIAPLVLITQDPALRLFIPDEGEEEHSLDSVSSIIDPDSVLQVRMPLEDHHQDNGDMCWMLPDAIDLDGVDVKLDTDKFIDPR